MEVPFRYDGCETGSTSTFKFYNHAELSTSGQLVVQSSRTLDGHKQQWAYFELADGRKITGKPKLQWKTKYVPVSQKVQTPNSNKGISKTATVPQFCLDLAYLSSNPKYRFAIRIHRAVVSSFFDEKYGQCILVYILHAWEWDPPKDAQDYDKQPETPKSWLKLPTIIKLFASDAKDFERLKLEMMSLCSSQNMIVWSADLGSKYTKEATKLGVSEALQRTKQVVASDAGAGQKPQLPDNRDLKLVQEPDDNYDNPFALQRSSLLKTGNNLPKPPHSSHPKKNQEPKPRPPGSTSVRARTVDPETHKEMRRGRLSAPPERSEQDDLFFRDESSSPEPAVSRRDDAKKKLSLMNTGKRMASSPPPISSASPRAAKRQSRWGPDLQSGPSPEDQRLVSLGEIPRENQIGSPSERRGVNNKSMSPTKRTMEDKRRSFGEQIAKAAATGFARVKPKVIHCEPEPGFIWTGKGRCLEVEFKRKLTLTEEVIVQWAEEWDRRHGVRSGPVDLERLHQLRETQDTNEAEQSVDDAKMHDLDRG